MVKAVMEKAKETLDFQCRESELGYGDPTLNSLTNPLFPASIADFSKRDNIKGRAHFAPRLLLLPFYASVCLPRKGASSEQCTCEPEGSYYSCLQEKELLKLTKESQTGKRKKKEVQTLNSNKLIPLLFFPYRK